MRLKYWQENIIRNAYCQAALLMLICLAVFSLLHFTPYLSDPDSFYHIKISEAMAEKGIITEFPYLQSTILKNNFVDHHLLYHAYLIPFIKLLQFANSGTSAAIWGSKIGHLILNCFVFLGVFIFLKKFKVKYALILSTSMLLSAPFIFRMILIKAQPLSILLSLFCVYCIIKKKHLLLFVASFIYVWAYSAWFMVLLLGALYVIANSSSAISHQNKWLLNLKKFIQSCLSKENLKLLAVIFSGLVAGLIINPYFPKNLYFYFVHIIQIGLINDKSIRLGMEWYPFSPSEFIIACLLPFAILILPAVFHLSYWKQMSVKSKFLLFVSLFFFIMTMRSKRHIEYFIPFSILAGGIGINDALSVKNIKADWEIIIGKMKKFLSFKFLKYTALIAFSLSIISISFGLRAQSQIYPFFKLKNSATYLYNNSQDDETLLNLRWDMFPFLYYWNDKNYYATGLDPTFTYSLDKNLWKEYDKIVKGNITSSTSAVINEKFNAQYIIAFKYNEKFLKEAGSFFEKVYEDDDTFIYKIKEKYE